MAQGIEKRWYVRDYVDGHPRQIWSFDGQAAKNMCVSNPEIEGLSYFKAAPGEDFLDCIRRQTHWLEPGVTEGRFFLMTRGPGEFYPRIARPLALARQETPWSPILSEDKAYVANAKSQLILLVRKLETICHIVQPSTKTLHVYGHDIRNLLILAATEVEMHCRGILKANGSLASKFNTNEYIKLVDPLRLVDYAVTFLDFPDLQSIRPFAGWSKADPTKTLGWYDAYHGVKHNRENEFERSTLRYAFEGVSARIALLVAQLGPVALSAELSSVVGLEVPNWPIGEMYYLQPGLGLADWVPINYPGL
jgi:hypothetical protein